MKKILVLMGLLALLLAAGCGGGDETAADKVEAAAEDAQVATHDCDGGCGMKAVPVDQLTEKDGKFYCAGCLKKVEEEDHSGHNHG
jgi:hypothetical protein|nr:hypothetical protein [Candidatus Krumholzibacteria bacterium]